MEQIRLDPLSPFYSKREPHQTSATGDLFASLLDGKLKSAADLKSANDPVIAAAKPDAIARERRMPYVSPRHIHQTSASDPAADEASAKKIKAEDPAEARIKRHGRAKGVDDDLDTPNAKDADSAAGCVGASANAAAGTADNSTATPKDAQGNSQTQTGQSDAGSTDGQPQPNPTEPIAEADPATTAVPSILTVPVPQVEDAGVPAAAASNSASPEEAAAIAQAATIAAATTLPEGSLGGTPLSTDIDPQAGSTPQSTVDGKAKTPTVAVNDNAAAESLIAAGADHAAAAGNPAAQPAQSAGLIFRQSSAGAKARPQGPGQGAADAQSQTHQPAPIMAQKPGSSAQVPVADTAGSQGAAGSGTAMSDSEFGMTDQGGMAGWAQHLTPAAAGKSASFLANLRQHMQNLPAYEQVAVHIQRAVNDRIGKLTVDLSPVELGRIQVKLKIDEENRVAATVTVERPATLDLLQRDSRALERALQEAGLKTDGGSLSFSLQGGETGNFDQDQGSLASGGTAKQADGIENTAVAANSARPDVVATSDGLVDVEV